MLTFMVALLGTAAVQRGSIRGATSNRRHLKAARIDLIGSRRIFARAGSRRFH
jgi:hypothetical protein